MTASKRTAGRRSAKALGLGLAVVISGLLLAGCEEEEQNRILMFEKGTYLGQEDNAMGDTQAEELRQRAKHQGAL